jgi:hypothetical protein
MLDAERAFAEIEWFLARAYPAEKKKAIRDRAFKFAASSSASRSRRW